MKASLVLLGAGGCSRRGGVGHAGDGSLAPGMPLFLFSYPGIHFSASTGEGMLKPNYLFCAHTLPSRPPGSSLPAGKNKESSTTSAFAMQCSWC